MCRLVGLYSPDEHFPEDEYSTTQPNSFGSSCMGATIAEKSGKAILNVTELVDARTESAKCIDCIYMADRWCIEYMQLIYAFGGSVWEEELLVYSE